MNRGHIRNFELQRVAGQDHLEGLVIFLLTDEGRAACAPFLFCRAWRRSGQVVILTGRGMRLGPVLRAGSLQGDSRPGRDLDHYRA